MLIGRFKVAMQVQSMELNISALPTQFTLYTLFLFFSKHTEIYIAACQTQISLAEGWTTTSTNVSSVWLFLTEVFMWFPIKRPNKIKSS